VQKRTDNSFELLENMKKKWFVFETHQTSGICCV